MKVGFRDNLPLLCPAVDLNLSGSLLLRRRRLSRLLYAKAEAGYTGRLEPLQNSAYRDPLWSIRSDR
jgi:hypothetical protein